MLSRKNLVLSRVNIVYWAVAAACLAGTSTARADAFNAYTLQRTVRLPAGASSFDVLPDGRIVTMVNASVQIETTAGAFNLQGTLAGADVSPGAYATGFIKVSPDGTRIAVGNNGGAAFDHYQVGVFELATLSGAWFSANHYQAAWIDDTTLALTVGTWNAPSTVTALDTTSAPFAPNNPTLIDHIGGASGGIAFDAAGRLYTANGYAGAGPSTTGSIKAFEAADWTAALNGGSPLDFEAAGTQVAELLSGQSLGFDADGNLYVGGGDLAEDYGFAALASADGLAAALAGGDLLDAADAAHVRQLDPDPVNGSNFYDLAYNAATSELFLRDGRQVYVYGVPEPAALALLLAGLTLIAARRKS